MKSIRYGLLCVAVVFAAHNQTVFAQHEGHTMPPPKPAATPKATPTSSPQMPAEQTEMDMSGHMDHCIFVIHDDQMFLRIGQNESNLMPMGRMGSGTSWQPDSSPMPMMHKQSGEW